MSTKFKLDVSYGSPWYVGFLDPQNVHRLLPVRRRWFGRKWTLTNCPKADCFNRSVFIISNGKENITPKEALLWMKVTHRNVETYLEKLNAGQWILLDPEYFETDEFQRSS